MYFKFVIFTEPDGIPCQVLGYEENNAGKRKDCLNFCLFCKKSVYKIVRHLQEVHMEEQDVKRFMELPPRSASRKIITSRIRLDGNNQHNLEVLGTRTGSMSVARVTKGSSKGPDDYVPCINCRGYYVTGELRRHKCSAVVSGASGPERRRGTVKEGRAFIQASISPLSKEVEAIFTPMLNDDVFKAIRNDPVVIDFLSLQLGKGEGNKPLWVKNIRYRLRLLGRFKMEYKKLDKNASTLTQILRCQNFLKIVDAALKVGTTRTEEDPDKEQKAFSVPVKLGFMIKGTAEVIQGAGLRTVDREVTENAGNLLKLYENEWGNR